MLALSPSMQSTFSHDSFEISTILLNITAPNQQFLSDFEGLENRTESELQLENHVELLRCYHRLQTMPPDEEFSIMLDLTWELIEILRTFVNSEKLVTYDTELISIFEDIITLLLFTGWQTELLVPKSWRQRYISHWVIFFGRASEDEQLQCQRALQDLYLLFCEVVKWLGDTNDHGTQVNGMLLNRRILDLVVIGLINIRMSSGSNTKSDRENSVDFSDLITEIQDVNKRVLRTQMLSLLETRSIPGPAQLIQPLLDAYKHYNGKDHLCLYICRNRQGIPLHSYTTWLKTLGVKIKPRPNCLQGHQGCGTVLKSPPSESSLVIVMLRLNAAKIIQRSFRAYLRITTETRARAAKIIVRFCRTYVPQKRAERRVNAACVIQTAYRNVQRKRAELRAHQLIRHAWLQYKRDTEHQKTQESKAVRNIQIAFQKKREAKLRPKIWAKAYYKLIAVMLTEGIKLAIELAILDERCDTLLAEAETGEPIYSRVSSIKTEILELRNELCQHSDNFRGLDMSEIRLRDRISQGLEFVKNTRTALDSVITESDEESEDDPVSSSSQCILS